MNGKIVYCEAGDGLGPALAEAAGSIILKGNFDGNALGPPLLPASFIDLHAASKVFNYHYNDSVRYNIINITLSSNLNYISAYWRTVDFQEIVHTYF